MSPHVTSASSLKQRLSIFHVLLLTAFLVVCGIGVGLSTAQSPQQGEREIEDKIPKHLPIKVKIRNLEKIKDLNNEQWGRDVEVEVQNTGNKPIYYLRLSLYFVDIKPEAADLYGWPLRYGRPELVDLDNRATPTDVPIQPGETYVFKVPDGMLKGWGKYKAAHNLSHPKKIGLQFELLNYGDGTGFSGTGGTPLPHPPNSSLNCGKPDDNITNSKVSRSVLLNGPPDVQFNFSSFLPANFLPVNFLSAKMVEPVSSAPPIQSGICCPSTSCFYLKTTLGGNCFCEDELGEPAVEVHATACTDPAGQCGTQHTIQFTCSDGSAHPCTTYFLVSCQTPTPSPTPSGPPPPCPSPPGADVRGYGSANHIA